MASVRKRMWVTAKGTQRTAYIVDYVDGRGVRRRKQFERYSTGDLVASRPSDVEREAARLPVTVVLDNVRSAHNVGLMFRLCDCVNVEALWLSGITAYPGVSEKATNRIQKTGVGGSLDVVPCHRTQNQSRAG